jgi:hypothetical protein
MFILVGDVEVWLFWTEDGMKMSVCWAMMGTSQEEDHLKVVREGFACRMQLCNGL